jgi:hypothetical protein
MYREISWSVFIALALSIITEDCQSNNCDNNSILCTCLRPYRGSLNFTGGNSCYFRFDWRVYVYELWLYLSVWITLNDNNNEIKKKRHYRKIFTPRNVLTRWKLKTIEDKVKKKNLKWKKIMLFTGHHTNGCGVVLNRHYA